MRRRSLVLGLLLALASCSDDTTPPALDRGTAVDRVASDRTTPEATVSADVVRRDAPEVLPDLLVDGPAPEVGTLDAVVVDAVVVDAPVTCGKLGCDCTAHSSKTGKSIKLFGLTQELTVGIPDFKVRVVTFNGQLKVKTGSTFPTKCGEWQQTGAGLPAFTYQVVQVGEDFTLQYDQVFPGINTTACPSCK
jgi:hypothetical protein